ncbi:MAG: DUF1566 domain-containing protein [Sulfurovum sp.]|nr:DUF1566 domain-containing protein [Sulfurovum sp.]MCB4744882.1 DUF1566 domain-containing protein [Sulfurovum sp.]MCB4746115.1 DUF1566 domain-containing protein [Sulfurovum sp.]MCB4748266.1 DUF1566 domain-containing protein [Sulfurovum sp.]MCB4749597.1 DUF1566 domain-containing protein [Sulfurovum sp.]
MPKLILLFTFGATLLFSEATMVRDTRTGLMWEDTSHTKETKITHPRAKAYCHQLKLGNFSNWRLPTIKELLSIVDYNRIEPATLKVFDYIKEDSFYWTSTPVAKEDDEFWGINFKHGESSRASEYYDRYVRCTRNIK